MASSIVKTAARKKQLEMKAIKLEELQRLELEAKQHKMKMKKHEMRTCHIFIAP